MRAEYDRTLGATRCGALRAALGGGRKVEPGLLGGGQSTFEVGAAGGEVGELERVAPGGAGFRERFVHPAQEVGRARHLVFQRRDLAPGLLRVAAL